MASSVSGQDMNCILRCDWLPERSCLARLGLPAVSRKKNSPESHIINTLLTKFGRDGWILASFFFASLKKRTRPISRHLDLILGQ